MTRSVLLVTTVAMAALALALVAFRKRPAYSVPASPATALTAPAPSGQTGFTYKNPLGGEITISVSDLTVKQLGSLLTGVFNLKPHLDNESLIRVTGTRDVSTYTFLEDTEYVENLTTVTHLASTRRLKIWASYRCAIGMDLMTGLRARVEGKEVRIEYPPPRILSTELSDFGMWSSDGLWNWVSEDERVATMKRLQKHATELASRDEIFRRACQRFEDHLRGLIQTIDPSLNVNFIRSAAEVKQ